MTSVDPIQQLRMAAISERLGDTVGSDQLIQAALDAVLAGVDSPALVELAGLVLQRQGVMFGALSLVVASSGSGLVDSAPV